MSFLILHSDWYDTVRDGPKGSISRPIILCNFADDNTIYRCDINLQRPRVWYAKYIKMA